VNWRLFKKELMHILRDRGLVIFIIYAFSIDIALAAKGFQLIPQNISIAVMDESRSPESRELISMLQVPAFRRPLMVENKRELDRMIENSEVVLSVLIPSDFQKSLYRQGASVQVLVDGTQSSASYLSSTYFASVACRFSKRMLEEGYMHRGLSPPGGFQTRTRILFNPEPRDDIYEGLVEFFMVITLLGMIVPASVLIREREYGTIEQIMLSPLGMGRLILFKVLASMVLLLSMITMTYELVLQGWLGFPVRASLLEFLLVSATYLLSALGLSFFIASVAKRFSQIGMLAIVIFAPMILLSGGWVPPEALPELLRSLTVVSPLKQFMDIGVSMVIRGATVGLLGPKLLWLFLLGLVILTIGVVLYRRRIL
jgi:ABC-2 type transport system permease protein